MSAYTYTKINDLELNSDLLQNFYGKIVYIHENREDEKQIITLLKDETASIYMCVTNKEGQKVDFKLRQIVRVHRCRVRMNLGLKMAMVAVGKSGCHLVAWPQFGDTEVPAIISSKNWTKSEQDREEIRLLSEPLESEKNMPPTNREEVVAQLQYYRVLWRIGEDPENDLNRENDLNDSSEVQQEKLKDPLEAQQDELDDPSEIQQDELNNPSEVQQEELNAEQTQHETFNEEQLDEIYERHINNLFKKKIGTPIESERFSRVNGSFPIDTTHFNEISVEEIMKFVLICDKCIVKRCSVVFTTGGSMDVCDGCNRKWDKFKMTFRVRIVSATHKLFLNIPIDQIKGGQYNSHTKKIIKMFDYHEKRDEFNQQMEQLRQTLQDIFANVSLANFKGFVVSRKQETKTIELYLTKFKISKPIQN